MPVFDNIAPQNSGHPRFLYRGQTALPAWWPQTNSARCYGAGTCGAEHSESAPVTGGGKYHLSMSQCSPEDLERYLIFQMNWESFTLLWATFVTFPWRQLFTNSRNHAGPAQNVNSNSHYKWDLKLFPENKQQFNVSMGKWQHSAC